MYISSVYYSPDVLREAEEKVRLARKRLLTSQSRQKSYADRRRRDIEFMVGDRVFLKVSPMRGVKRFGVREKLSPRYIGPYEILERVGTVVYRLALPPKLADVTMCSMSPISASIFTTPSTRCYMSHRNFKRT
uniref:Tf2-1-like SH3-like domain-containing protein n=1 Tax=Ananas comosus var. bracteatus TaxID=296719 RepID=A0A6V7NT38_ANACO|nr:unnamed protein product [Ananas comosus var. bracteatus]